MTFHIWNNLCILDKNSLDDTLKCLNHVLRLLFWTVRTHDPSVLKPRPTTPPSFQTRLTLLATRIEMCSSTFPTSVSTNTLLALGFKLSYITHCFSITIAKAHRKIVRHSILRSVWKRWPTSTTIPTTIIFGIVAGWKTNWMAENLAVS